jgi:hypothetical protein
MTTKTQTYRCWFLINQNQQKRDFETLEQEASRLFLDFISDKDYGDSIGLFRFDIYIEPKINFGRHTDTIYTGCAHLSVHIDKATFDKSTDELKVKLLLNAAFVLTKYLALRVPLPKNFQADSLVNDYENYLTEKSLLLSDDQMKEVIIKPFDTTRFNFVITTTAEVKDRDIHYDLNEVGDFINNNLAGQTFGTSIRKFDFGYEIADSKGYMPHHPETANLRRYGTKYKNLLVVKQFDYRQLKDLDDKGQFKILKEKILEAISDVDKLSKKPKDFDKEKFFDTIRNILTDYEKKHWH